MGNRICHVKYFKYIRSISMSGYISNQADRRMEEAEGKKPKIFISTKALNLVQDVWRCLVVDHI